MKRILSVPFLLMTLLLGIGSITLFGCAEERPPINRVQPYALQKAYFVGADFNGIDDDPEFWSQATLVDVGYGAAEMGLFTSTYAQPMSRVKWQITEDHLIARVAYERIEDSDGKGVGGPTQDGVIAAVFEIKKHFDIVNAYNPTTGEQLNILEENDRDRPWYEREYIRVDWSKNLNVDSYDFDTLSLLGVYGGVTYEPLAYSISDPNDPEAPVFEFDTGYFDVTTRAFAKPGEIDLSHLGWGIKSFPACFLPADFMGGSAPAGNCNPVELTVRHAFRRVEDRDFEPVDWDGFRFQSYGGFYVERYGYARNYGMSDSKWNRFLARYNIWQRSHYYTDPVNMTGEIPCFTEQTTPFGANPHRDTNLDGTEDECAAAGPGSRCDEFNHKCTLPLGQRTLRPIVWYFTRESSYDYYEGTRLAAHEWDVAMRVAVLTSQYAECKRVGGTDCDARFPVYFGQQEDNADAIALAREVDDCRIGVAYPELNQDPQACRDLALQIGQARGYANGVIGAAQMEELVVLCHSPVEANDPAACGPERLPAGITAAQCQLEWEQAPKSEIARVCDQALSVRMGDLRYHQVNVIRAPQSPSPWGIYTDAEDPLTGETISASINVWSHVNDLFSQKVVDLLRYAKGELTTDEVTDGEYVHRWAEASSAASSSGIAAGMTAEEVSRRLADFSGTRATQAENLPTPPPEMMQLARELRDELTEVRASIDAPSQMRAIYNARMNHARGTEFEAELMTPMMQQLHGVQNLPLSDTIMDMVSPLRGGNPALARDFYHRTELALAERGACILHEAPAPIALTGLADIMQEKFGAFNPSDAENVQQDRAERMRQYIAQRAHYAVIVHEMGHSVGMRHNFVSSSDAFNYRPQYWQLRTKNGSVVQTCNSLQDANGAEDCIGPRYFDPMTENERKNLLWMFMHSSVMDYAGELTQDMLGLGAYDFAAPKMFYGDTVAVYSDPSFASGTTKASGLWSKMDSFGGILGFQWRQGQNDIHYSQLQSMYSLIRNCAEVDPNTFRPAGWNEGLDGAWHPVLDGRMVSVDGTYSRCDSVPVDYVQWSALGLPTQADLGETFYRGGPSIDNQGRIRVPYGFATDRWADLGNLAVYRHDNGADPYELFDFLITQQEINHIFDNYRRDRQNFSVSSAANRTLRRYNEKLRDGAKGLSLFRNIYSDFALTLGYNFDDFWPSIAPLFFKENILASGLAFDHFARMLARPEHGPHFYENNSNVLSSTRDYVGNAGATEVVIPNGATGFLGDIGIGGQPVENQLASDQGEYDSEYTLNAGSYYGKLYTSMLFTESVDNFISSSRTDFVDARYRATSLADLFPEGYRRMLANALTNDRELKGPRLATNAAGAPLVDGAQYPTAPIGWTTWWGDEPRTCFPRNGSTICSTYGAGVSALSTDPAITNTRAIDPQIGWEQQKFLIAWTMLFLPENQQQKWVDMMRVWEIGIDSDPVFQNRIEFHAPTGKVYAAKTYGTEEIFGKTIQRGIAARVLEYANSLLVQAYETTTVTENGVTWYVPVIDPVTGSPRVLFDDTVSAITPEGFVAPQGKEGCDAADNSQCTCTANRACMELESYITIPAYLRESVSAYGIGLPSIKGIY